MELICDRSAGEPDKPSLILLPGAYMHAADFLEHRFIATARQSGMLGDIAAVETGMECYLDGSIVQRIHEATRQTRSGTGRWWLAGISLGGLGALLYAEAHPERVAGLLLLSPFLGTRGVVAQVIGAGGFEGWTPPAGDQITREHRLLNWLQSYRATSPDCPKIHLGYGKDDRFAASYRLLASILPSEHVVAVPGGHDWTTWTVLWDRILRIARRAV